MSTSVSCERSSLLAFTDDVTDGFHFFSTVTGTRRSKEAVEEPTLKKVAEELKEVVTNQRLTDQERQRRLDELLAGKCDSKIVNYQYERGETLLHILCRQVNSICNIETVVQTLLEKGADVDSKDIDGNTVLHIAVEMVVPAKVLEDIIGKTDYADCKNGAEERPVDKLFKPVGECKRMIRKEFMHTFIAKGVDVIRDLTNLCAIPNHWQSVILQSPAPVAYAVEIADVLKSCAAKDEVQKQLFLDTAESVEQIAVELIEGCSRSEAYSILTDQLMCYALDNGLKKV